MSEGIDRESRALWRRWRDDVAETEGPAAQPDPMAVAAYAERRLGRLGGDPEADPEIAAVEAWLADQSEAVEDIVTARRDEMPTESAPASIMAWAEALVAGASANVVLLRAARPRWRYAVAWSGVAASLVAASLVGFSLGATDLLNLSGGGQTQAYDQDFIGPSASLIVRGDLDSGI
jgi:hypothetical protein